MELQRASVSMTDLRSSSGCQFHPMCELVTACGGVRGLQQVRRSRSTSRLGGRVHGKVKAAKEYINKHGLDSHYVAAKLLSTGNVFPSSPPLLKSKQEAPLALQSKPAAPAASFRNYYQQNFARNSPCKSMMEALYEQFISPVAALQAKAAPCNQDTSSFSGYYQQHFLGNSLTQEAFQGLYKSFGDKSTTTPAALQSEDTSSFTGYYKQHFQAALPEGLYESFASKAVLTPTAALEAEAASPSFGNYYRQHFQGNSLGQDALQDLYKNFGVAIKTESAAEPVHDSAQRDFRHKPSVATWCVPTFKIECIAVPQEPEIRVHSEPEFRFKPSVATLMVTNFKVRSITAPEEAKVTTITHSEPEFRFKPSVATWKAPILKVRCITPAEELQTPDAIEQAQHSTPSQIRFKPSVASWMAPRIYLKPKALPAPISVSDEVENEGQTTTAANPLHAEFRYKPSVGSWAVPRLAPRRQKNLESIEKVEDTKENIHHEAAQHAFQQYYTKHFLGNSMPANFLEGLYASMRS